MNSADSAADTTCNSSRYNTKEQLEMKRFPIFARGHSGGHHMVWLEARRASMPVVLIFTLVLAAAALSGCGSQQDEAAEARTVTVVENSAPAPTQTVTVAPESEEIPSAQSTPPAAAGEIKVPDVVGLDHQLAQDTMQASGLYNLSEEDATGQGRMLLWDRNWTVVSQDPAAGTMVAEDQTITLSSKKDDE
jgi:hypothetical protein